MGFIEILEGFMGFLWDSWNSCGFFEVILRFLWILKDFRDSFGIFLGFIEIFVDSHGILMGFLKIL